MGASGLAAVGVPTLPPWLVFVKGAIILFSMAVLALSAYALSISDADLYYYGVYYSSGVPGFLIFLAVKSWILYGASILAERFVKQHYYRVVFLIAYIISIIFWLAGWAWAASWAAEVLTYIPSSRFGSAMAGCAALGAVIWILCIMNLALFISACVKGTSSTGNLELGQSQKQSQSQNIYVQQPYTGQPGQPQAIYTQPQQGYVQTTYATQ